MNSCDTAYRKMFNAWRAGEYAFALELSRELLQEYPDYNIGWMLQGVILYELARYDEAEQVLHNAIQGVPLEHLPHGYVHLGHLCRERGDYDDAEKWYSKAIELDPDNAGRHIFLGALLAKRGDFSGAEVSHRDATRCSGSVVDEAYLNLGLVLRAQERYKEALACFEKVLALTPDYQEAITAKADIEKAIAYLQTTA
jgi:tetratricopeptide (TPR) repeat protein